jgi:hypothetical protein
MIHFECAKCGKRFCVPDTLAGQSGPCPSCKTRLVIPDIDAGRAESVSSPPVPPSGCEESSATRVIAESPPADIAQTAPLMENTLGKDGEPSHAKPVKSRKTGTTTFKLGALIGGLAILVYVFNYVNLQSPMSQVVESDPRNSGIEVAVHYGYYIDLSTITYDLRSIEGQKSMMDVFRVLLQYAASVKDKRFDRVELCCRGQMKFLVSGEYFQQLGREYAAQNPVYTMRTFSENLVTPDGQRAFPVWTGGLLGVLQKQMEDFNEFHQRWYIRDLALH